MNVSGNNVYLGQEQKSDVIEILMRVIHTPGDHEQKLRAVELLIECFKCGIVKP